MLGQIGFKGHTIVYDLFSPFKFAFSLQIWKGSTLISDLKPVQLSNFLCYRLFFGINCNGKKSKLISW